LAGESAAQFTVLPGAAHGVLVALLWDDHGITPISDSDQRELCHTHTAVHHDLGGALTLLDERRAEYDRNIWDHTQDAFQLGFDDRAPLEQHDLTVLVSVVKAFEEGLSDEEVSTLIARAIGTSEPRLFVLMQVAGLTRNKILTDMKAATGKAPSKPGGLLKSATDWAVAGPYLAARLRKVLEPLTSYEDPQPALEAISQVSWPGWIRQERAKRQGHEAEARVAVMLKALGIPFVPAEKAETPMCKDAQIDGISYDLVVPNLQAPVMVMKSTVQTSNIGQFGESKASLEVTEAKASLARAYTNPPTLIAMIDGVGFKSNIAGLNGVLEGADEFCQFKTVWKAAVVAAHWLKTPLSVALPAESLKLHDDFLATYGLELTTHEASGTLRTSLDPKLIVDAGEAFLWA